MSLTFAFGFAFGFTFTLSIREVSAFGYVGHYLIGAASQQLVSPHTWNRIQECHLLDGFGQNMGRASVWADVVKGKPGYQWTKKLHYVDAIKDPPVLCNNITETDFHASVPSLLTTLHDILANTTNLLPQCPCPPPFDFNMLIHLMQDLHQPLHLTGKARGGTQKFIEVRGTRYNFHTFWDSVGIRLMMAEDLPNEARSLSGAVRHFVAMAKEATGVEKPVSPVSLLKWANEVGRENCQLVWQTKDVVDDNYVTASKDLLANLLTAAILRLVAVLDTTFACRPKLVYQSGRRVHLE